jgi:hypothetical protein
MPPRAGGLIEARAHRDRLPRQRRRRHCVHRVHDEVEQDLLELHAVAADLRQIGRQRELERKASRNQLAVQEIDRGADERIELDDLGRTLILLQEPAHAVDHGAGTLALVHDVADGGADLGQVG